MYNLHYRDLIHICMVSALNKSPSLLQGSNRRNDHYFTFFLHTSLIPFLSLINFCTIIVVLIYKIVEDVMINEMMILMQEPCCPSKEQ